MICAWQDRRSREAAPDEQDLITQTPNCICEGAAASHLTQFENY